MRHVLKCWPEQFDATEAGDKMFEFRKNDRDFQVDDTLVLLRYHPQKGATGEIWHGTVTYVLREGFGLPEGYCVLSIKQNI